ncbi:MAG: hypothetical protein KF729_12675 [Sandaracinaceae bacterium]|nr:hypothetical protein [Sandaracinaceae bacterium]
MRAAPLLLCVLALAGCERRQAWTFQNGSELDEARPPLLVAEVYTGGECGFACQPPGQQVYCEELAGDARGSAPEGLRQGERYCFMGTALDAASEAYAIGCAVGTVGGEPIQVVLSPVEPGRVLRRRCQRPGPMVRFDAGLADGGLDAGPGFDAGPAFDAGPGFDAGFDAGTQIPADAGPAVDYSRPVRVYFEVSGSGTVGVFDSGGSLMGGWLTNGHRLWVDAWVGFYARIEASPGGGQRVQRIGVPHCANASPCEFLFVQTETIPIVFGP